MHPAPPPVTARQLAWKRRSARPRGRTDLRNFVACVPLDVEASCGRSGEGSSDSSQDVTGPRVDGPRWTGRRVRERRASEEDRPRRRVSSRSRTSTDGSAAEACSDLISAPGWDDRSVSLTPADVVTAATVGQGSPEPRMCFAQDPSVRVRCRSGLPSVQPSHERDRGSGATDTQGFLRRGETRASPSDYRALGMAEFCLWPNSIHNPSQSNHFTGGTATRNSLLIDGTNGNSFGRLKKSKD